jgi:hypothetical protein
MNNNEKLPIGTEVLVKLDSWEHIQEGRVGVIVEPDDFLSPYDYKVKLLYNGHEMPAYASEITPLVAQKPAVQFPKQAQRDRKEGLMLCPPFSDYHAMNIVYEVIHSAEAELALHALLKKELDKRNISEEDWLDYMYDHYYEISQTIISEGLMRQLLEFMLIKNACRELLEFMLIKNACRAHYLRECGTEC